MWSLQPTRRHHLHHNTMHRLYLLLLPQINPPTKRRFPTFIQETLSRSQVFLVGNHWMVRQMISTPTKVKAVELSYCHHMNRVLIPRRSQPQDISPHEIMEKVRPHEIMEKVRPKLEMTTWYSEESLISIANNGLLEFHYICQTSQKCCVKFESCFQCNFAD